jgi:hypothetical protein
MANIVPASGGGYDRRESRMASRMLVRLESQTDVGLARIEQAAELQAGRVRAVGHVGKKALTEIALVSQLEAQLSAIVPMATSRLQAIGDMAALETADVVSETVRRVSRGCSY